MTTATPAWAEVMSTALVGTDRTGPPTWVPPTAADPASGLLEVAALLAVSRRAGGLPDRDVARPARAPDEARPMVGAAAGNRLTRLLGGNVFDADARSELTREWLSLAAGRGLVAPPQSLPALLEAGRASRELRSLVAVAGGNRARWLAEQRPSWGYLLEEADDPDEVDLTEEFDEPYDAATRPAAAAVAWDETRWQEGSAGTRAALLARARRGDPDAARDHLVAAWSKEPAANRERFIATLGIGLGPGDEVFLEKALDDRAKGVRQQAVRLLARLSGSAYQERMAQRARAAVRLDGSGGLIIEPPAEVDPAMVRDGLSADPGNGAGYGKRAWWLEALVAATPLSTWLDYAPDPTTFLLHRPDADGWAENLVRGLARAAARERDVEWARQLLASPSAKALLRPSYGTRPAEGLYELLPPAELSEHARDLLTDDNASQQVYQLLMMCPAPWPADLGTAVLDRVVVLITRERQGYRADSLCQLAARKLSPSAAADVAARAAALRDDEAQYTYERAIERLAEILHFRQKMIEELA
ncbi:DUF5691 domain-containing protein [Polymorphospora rubra]|uniref:Uncharacterized protein n=1 Tax=Polymorphospora rubra TaxID=338584 RepID=A0A810MWG9_9ACTN|nr:DUF5691 domain-containing protein [Polymorphospora rubra]BCJ65526.1 hypothetical protein Prubr_25470 [Polymorphospora rubra]